MEHATHHDIASAVLAGLYAPDLPAGELLDVTWGSHLLAVRGAVAGAARVGLASRVDAHGSLASEGGSIRPASEMALSELARLLAEPLPVPRLGVQEPLLASAMALAAANALLPLPDSADNRKGQELIHERGAGRRVAVVGHFPFVERMAGGFAAFDVIERNPRPGDLPAEAAATILPEADVAAITATTISNGSLAGLLRLCRPQCFVLLLGPSTPFAPALFELGVDALAGAVVQDPDAVLDGIRQGRPFKALHGARPLLLLK